MIRSLFAAAIAFSLTCGCEPGAVVVREPTRAPAAPRAPAPSAPASDDLGLEETRDVYGDAHETEARALTADTDPSRLDGGTIGPGQDGATFACSIPGAPGAGFCARAVTGPFVVTDLRTAPGCGPEVFVSAIRAVRGHGVRWTMTGALDVHGGRLGVGADEALFVGAVAEPFDPFEPSAAPPSPSPRARSRRAAPEPERPSAPRARCSITWAGFRPYTAADARAARPLDRTLDRTLDVPRTRPDVLAPTPPLDGRSHGPRSVYDRLDGHAPAPTPPAERLLDFGY